MSEQQGPPRQYPSPPEPGSERPSPAGIPPPPVPVSTPATPVPSVQTSQVQPPTSLPGPWAVPQQVGRPTLVRAGWALASGIACLVLSMASLFNLVFLLLSIPLGALALSFGISGQRRIKASGGALAGRGLAVAGWICGVVGLALPLAVFLAFFMVGLVIGVTRALLGSG